MSLAEVARRAGVSLATASRVLSHSEYHVSDELRARVMKAAAEANYVPDAAARALSSRLGQTVGIIIGDVRDAYFAELVHGIQSVFDRSGRLLYICSSHWDPAKEADYIRLLHSNRVAAIIVACSEVPHPVYGPRVRASLDAFRNAGGIVVALGRDLGQAREVQPDNIAGGRSMAAALIALGHRHFGIISGPEGTVSREERLQGFYEAAEEARISRNSIHVLSGERSWEAGADAAQRLMARHPEITAIFGLNDKIALGALSQLQRLGYRVPEDVSVAGFDDILATRQSTPPLSTVRIDLARMSALLAEQALASRTERSLDEKITVPTQLVLRESTGPVRQAASADKASRKARSS
jgi:LacI family transcriptional regulator